jgi:hypothetical protein
MAKVRRLPVSETKSDIKAAEELFRTTIERQVRLTCHGSCRTCQAAYGGPDSRYDEWDDLASWIFGYCSNRCRLAAGEPREFDIDRALALLIPNPS